MSDEPPKMSVYHSFHLSATRPTARPIPSSTSDAFSKNGTRSVAIDSPHAVKASRPSLTGPRIFVKNSVTSRAIGRNANPTFSITSPNMFPNWINGSAMRAAAPPNSLSNSPRMIF